MLLSGRKPLSLITLYNKSNLSVRTQFHAACAEQLLAVFKDHLPERTKEQFKRIVQALRDNSFFVSCRRLC